MIERDIDGDRAETTELESKEPRFGQVERGPAGGADAFPRQRPSSVATKPGIRGLDRARVLLGCLQPGQTSSIYSDALNRLADRLHYLNSSGDKAQDATRFWFDTRANLRREMEDRKRRFDDKTEVRKKIAEALKKLSPACRAVRWRSRLHAARRRAGRQRPAPGRAAAGALVFVKEEPRQATDAVLEYLRKNGTKPRHRANRLIFLAADRRRLDRLRDATRVALAWASIVEDVDEGRLNIDHDSEEAGREGVAGGNEVLPRAARECYKWLLCPVQDDADRTQARPSRRSR